MEKSLNLPESNPQSDAFKETRQIDYPHLQDLKKSQISQKNLAAANNYCKKDHVPANPKYPEVEFKKEFNSFQSTNKPTESTKKLIPPGLNRWNDSQNNSQTISSDTSFPFSEFSGDGSIIHDPHSNSILSSLYNPNQPDLDDSKWDPFRQCLNDNYDQSIFPSTNSDGFVYNTVTQRKRDEQAILNNTQLQPQIRSDKPVPTSIPQIIFQQYLNLQSFTQEPKQQAKNSSLNFESQKCDPSLSMTHKMQPSSDAEIKNHFEQSENMIRIISHSIEGASKFLHDLCFYMKKKKPSLECIPKNNRNLRTFVACMRIDNFYGFGEAKSKQEAKNFASKELLRQIIESDADARNQLMLLIEKDKSISQLSKLQNLPHAITSRDDAAKIEFQQIQLELQSDDNHQKLFQKSCPLIYENDLRKSADDFPNKSDLVENEFQFENKIRCQSMKDPLQISKSKRKNSPKRNPEEFDSLEILNELSIDNKVHIKWEDITKGEGFVSKIIFDTLPMIAGSGNRKIEARRDAATKLYMHLIADTSLKEQYLAKLEKRKLQKGLILPGVKDLDVQANEIKEFKRKASNEMQKSSPSSLDNWMLSDVFLELKTYLQGIDAKKYEDGIERYLIQKLEALCFSDEEQTRFEAFCDYISTSVQKIASVEKPAPSTLNKICIRDLLKDMRLFPLGSYALGHLRRDHPIADFSLVFEPKEENAYKDISRLILELLFEHLKFDYKASSIIGFARFPLDIKFEHLSDGYEGRTWYVLLKDKNSGFGIRVFATQKVKLTRDLQKPEDQAAILHIAKMDHLLKRHENLREYFNKCCFILKYWRRKSGLSTTLRSEIIDIVVFEFASQMHTHSPGFGIYRILQTLMNYELMIQLLSKYSETLATHFMELQTESVAILQKECKISLKNLLEGRYPNANF